MTRKRCTNIFNIRNPADLSHRAPSHKCDMYVAAFNRKFLSYFIIIIFFLLFDGRRYLKEIESLKDIEIALDIAR